MVANNRYSWAALGTCLWFFAFTPPVWATNPASAVTAGFVEVSNDGSVHFYFDRSVPVDATIRFQTADKKGSPKCCSTVPAAQLQQAPVPPHYNLSNGSGSAVHYLWPQTPSIANKDSFLGIAVAASSVKIQGRYRLLARTAPTTRRTSVWLCYGAEGVNLLSQTGKDVSALYLGLGYEFSAKPKCNQSDINALGRAS